MPALKTSLQLVVLGGEVELGVLGGPANLGVEGAAIVNMLVRFLFHDRIIQRLAVRFLCFFGRTRPVNDPAFDEKRGKGTGEKKDKIIVQMATR